MDDPSLLPRLIFLHLDRTGGMSLISSLRELYESYGQIFIRTDNPEFGKHDCIAGHFQFEKIAFFSDYHCVTLLRDPVDRELSFLNKCVSGATQSWEQKLRARTASRNMAEYISNFINDGLYASRYTCGHCTLENAFAVLSSLDLVGVTQALGKFQERLSSLLGASLPPMQHLNQSVPQFQWTEDERAQVVSRLPHDYAIYNHALSLSL